MKSSRTARFLAPFVLLSLTGVFAMEILSSVPGVPQGLVVLFGAVIILSGVYIGWRDA